MAERDAFGTIIKPGNFSISKFISETEVLGGITRKWKHIIEIKPPATLISEVEASSISFLCSASQLPRRAFSTTEEKIYGIEKTIPYGVIYEPVTLSFINTNNFNPKIFWEDWLDHIQPAKTRNIQYYKNIIGSIKIFQFSDTAGAPEPGKEKYICTLEEAWPESISEITLDWEDAEIMKFDISIRYKSWSRKK